MLDAERPDGPMANAHATSLNEYNIGHSWYVERALPEAAAAFEAAIRVCEEAMRRGDQGRPIRLDLARALVYRCRCRVTAGKCTDAVEPAQRAIAIYRDLLEQSPSDYSCAHLLHLAQEELGFAYQGQAHWDDVIACHEAARRP